MSEPGTPGPAEPEARPVPPRRRGESQKDIERGVLIWVFVFTFGTHLAAAGVWLAMYLSDH